MIRILIISVCLLGVSVKALNQTWMAGSEIRFFSKINVHRLYENETKFSFHHEGGHMTSVVDIEQTEHSTSNNKNHQETNSHFQGQSSVKIRINEIKYESQALGIETPEDEYIELLVIDGGFDPSYWYVTDWDNYNYWEIPVSCPVVSTNEFILLHLGWGTEDNIGPVYHFYMNEISPQLANQGEQLILFTDNDATHHWEEDTAHDFIAYGDFIESDLSAGNAWCEWPNDLDVVTDSIELTAVNYESLQLVGNDLDNSSNWYSVNPTPGGANKLNHCYIENFDNPYREIYINRTATNASGLENGRFLLGIREPENVVYRYIDGSARGIFVQDDYAYVASGFGVLAIINVSDPINPGAPVYRDIDGGARGIFVQEDFAYVASGTGGLVIINVSNPINPEIVGHQDTTGNAWAVYVKGDLAYVADGRDGLAIINVSDPTNPGVLIYRNTTGDASDIHVHGNYAYVADRHDGLAIINVSDPINPGAPIYRQLISGGDTKSVHVRGDYIYITAHVDLVILNISNPTDPGRAIHQETTEGTYGVFVSGDYAYVANENNGLAIIDISDPIDPGTPVYRDTNGAAWDVYVCGEYVYVAAGDSGVAIVETARRASISIAQSTSCYTSTGFIQNVTLNANQTVFPNTSINYQISSNGNTWIPINLNESFSFVINPYHGLFWQAVLETEDTRGPSPRIDSLCIEFDVYYDEESPSISLTNIQNNTPISSGTVINCTIIDFTYSHSWFNWDQGTNFTLSDPWTIICPPLKEGYHWLVLSANDSAGHQTTNNYRFYVNYHLRIELNVPQNNSAILPQTTIDLDISNLTLVIVWYHWDQQETIFLSSPFKVKAITSSGWHVLTVGAQDSWNINNSQRFRFYILSSVTIDTIQVPPTMVYSGESFIYSFIITNTEVIQLNLMLLVIGTKDDVLSGNNSQFILTPGDNKTIELEIRPKHASTHQLEIYLLYEGLVYYNETLQFNVAPQWMSPSFLLQFLIIFLLFSCVITIAGMSAFYIRKQFAIHKLFWEQHDQLTQIIDQLTISNLEATAAKKIDESSRKAPSRPLGFLQYSDFSEPLDQEALEQQFYALREQIVNGDPRNYHKLSDLLTQAEELLKEPQEESL